jgi:hypothetical protein
MKTIPPETDNEASARPAITMYHDGYGFYVTCNLRLLLRQRHIRARRAALARAEQLADQHRAQLRHRAERLRALADDIDAYLGDLTPADTREPGAAPVPGEAESIVLARHLADAASDAHRRHLRAQIRAIAAGIDVRAAAVRPPAVIAPPPDTTDLGLVHLGYAQGARPRDDAGHVRWAS